MDRTVTVAGRDTTFPISGDQSVLEAALRANQCLPQSCSQGTCGTCKFRVLCGEVDHGNSDAAILPETERGSGLALACQSQPRGDVTVSPLDESAPDGPMHALRDHRGTVTELVDIVRGTQRLVVEFDDPMEFSAGQYAELLVPGSGVARQYSMADPPAESRRLKFHVRLTVGGLAPLKSIVQHALDHALLPSIHLYHGGRREVDLYDVEYFRALAAADPRLHYHPVLSEEDWDGATGMVTDAVAEDFASCKGYRAYLCGPPAMVAAAVKALKRRRMAPRLILREEFTAAHHEPVAVPA